MPSDLDYRMTLRLPMDMQKEYQRVAEEHCMTLAGWIRLAMREKYLRDTAYVSTATVDTIIAALRNPETRARIKALLDDE